ncbi:MAG: hypothetical protein D6773_05075, partial [Alphaproteobacteria bacterium]
MQKRSGGLLCGPPECARPSFMTQPMSRPDPAKARRLLDLYAQAGVDEAIASAPVDWFAQAQARQKEAPLPAGAARAPGGQLLKESTAPETRQAQRRPRPAAVAPDEAVMDARERAAAARTLEELEAALAGFEGCPLKA